MGAANQRGSKAERIAAAIAERMREEPINVPCKSCNEPLNGFTFIKASSAGAAWQKTCSCGAVTTALVQAQHSNLSRTFKTTLGLIPEITGEQPGSNNKPKVSVSFLEKTVDSVETGLIRLPKLN